MSNAKRAQWLLSHTSEWAGLGPAEVTDGQLSSRVERLIVQMREDELFPDWWDEGEVLIGFLGAVAEARQIRRQAYVAQVRATEGEETWSPAQRMAGATHLLRHSRAFVR